MMSADQPRSTPVTHPLHGVNRAVLLVLALLLVAAGVLALLVGIGQLVLDPGSSLVPAEAVDWLTARPWLWWVGAGVALLLALLGLWWLVPQLRTERVASVDLAETGAGGGITQVRSAGITEAVEDDAESIAGVARAHARVAGERTTRVELTVALTEDADVPRVRRAIEEQTVAHLRTALDAPDLPVHVELRAGAQPARERSVR